MSGSSNMLSKGARLFCTGHLIEPEDLLATLRNSIPIRTVSDNIRSMSDIEREYIENSIAVMNGDKGWQSEN